MSLDVTLSRKPCPECGHSLEGYSSNITHNLGKMARSAGIYEHLWRPEEIGITKASQLIKPLRAGIVRMLTNPSKFKLDSDPAGWGTYEQFLPWVEQYLAACERMPDADVSVSR